MLVGEVACRSDLERVVTVRAIDDLWADYLADVAEFRSGVHWLSWGRRDPHHEYLRQIRGWFGELEASLPGEVARRLAEAQTKGSADPRERGSVWTYVTTDQPFGSWTERVLRGLSRRLRPGELPMISQQRGQHIPDAGC
jgi:preprotein translocase subunit SecA